MARRATLLGLAAGAILAAAPLQAFAEDEPTAAGGVYTDSEGFKISVPSGWKQAEGQLDGNRSFSGATGARRTLAWFPEAGSARDVNVSLVITNTSVEFTKMGSFGNVYGFAQTLVASQDRSQQLRSPEWARGKDPIQFAKLLDARERNDTYVVEYTIEKPPEAKKYLLSVVSLSPNRLYNRLFTITAQCNADQVDKYQKVLSEMAMSFVPPPKLA